MLTIARRLTTLIALSALGVLILAIPAHAADCTAWGDTDPNQDGLQYGCIEWSGGGGSDIVDEIDGGSGGTAPQCTFFDIWNDFCSGKRACYLNDPAAIQDVDRAREDTPGLAEMPEDADHLVFTSCRENASSPEIRLYRWDTEVQTITVEDRIRAARGALNLPTITPVFNPPTRTLVNLDTWWWASGPPAGEIVGSPALGMRAIASPRDMTVTAGGQSITCPVVTQQSDACAMTFRRAGQHAATMTITYDIRFEMGGTVISVPTGAQDLTTLTATGTTTVPVLEVQSLVTDLS